MRMISLNERYVAGPESNQWPLDSQSELFYFMSNDKFAMGLFWGFSA